MIVRNITSADLRKTAILHKQIFGEHFLGKFSTRLIRSYYKSFIEKNTEIVFIGLFNDDKLLGFILGGESVPLSDCINSFLKKNIFQYSIEALVRVLIWKQLIIKIKNLLYRKKGRDIEPSQVASYRLLSIGVNEQYKGKGISQLLLREFEAIIRNNGVNKYGLSVIKSNHRAISFYHKSGFFIEKEEKTALFLCKEIAINKLEV